MSQRHSTYARHLRDEYNTPRWVTRALVPHLPAKVRCVWEPAAGRGMMSRVLQEHCPTVYATDIAKQARDFLNFRDCPNNTDAIVTNPPFNQAELFIDHALALMKPVGGVVAMLLRVDFDSAKTRRYLFADCRAFSKKLVLTSRIRWIEGSTGSPSENHAWFVWDYKHRGPATIAYHFEE